MALPDGYFCPALLLKDMCFWTGNKQGARLVCRSASSPWCRASQCPSRTPPGWPGSLKARRLPWDNSLVKFTFPSPLSGAPSCVTSGFWTPNASVAVGPAKVWYVLEQWEAVICCGSSHAALESNRHSSPCYHFPLPVWNSVPWAEMEIS
uniref:Uncharacterized protein n=1 Tax=Aotus nancymaae TaxID=37293 RepID=A0A2K5E2R0_AOTNA